MSLFAELKRRNVLRVALLYIAVSWLLLQVADILLETLDVPEWGMRFILVLLIIGLPLAVIFSWVFEMTPEGLKREKDIAQAESVSAHTGKKIDYITMGVVALAVVFVIAERMTRSDVPATVTSAPGVSASVAENSIAVLPFVNMSEDASNEYFSDGLSEELLNVLARIPELRVAARTSSFHFKGHTGDVADIGRQLKVNNILEGSVRRAGDKVRITAQLIDVDEGYHIWSDTYDRDLTDIFAVQDEIAKAISAALKVTLNIASDESLVSAPTDNLEAYDLYLQGRHLWSTRVVRNLREAVEKFDAATKLDPDFALAWSGLADAIDALAWRDHSAIPLVPRGIAAAERAIELAPDRPEGYASLGILQLEFPWEFEAAEDNLRRAERLGPDYVPAVLFLSNALTGFGHHEEAVALCRRVLELDPLSVIVNSSCGLTFGFAGDPEESVRLGLRAIELSPELVRNRFMVGTRGHSSGVLSRDEVGRLLTEWAELSGAEEPERMLLLLDAGEDDSAHAAAMALVEELDEKRLATSLQQARMYVMLEENERAIQMIERAHRERKPQLVWVATDPVIPDEVRCDERIVRILAEMGLPNGMSE